MTSSVDDYLPIVGESVVDQLRQLAEHLQGKRIVHVNSTRVGGGVAEILVKLVPLIDSMGIDCSWEVIEGNADFFSCTKRFHNGLQGNHVEVSKKELDAYEQVNRENAERLRNTLEDADIVLIHDPQPAGLIQHFPKRKGKWIWRCHIDASHPDTGVWKFLKKYVQQYDASIFSLADFTHPLPHPMFLIPPSIDPLHPKNLPLDADEIAKVCASFSLDASRPMILQVSRYDRFKDPLGVIQAFRIAKKFQPQLQLVLAGGGASDDPEGEAVLAEVKDAAEGDENIHVLLLPADAHHTINALQRAADIVLQKSIKEGFGLTVTEALWKQKPVIGGNVGGIKLQVTNYRTGFLVNTPEGAAHAIRYLLHNDEFRIKMGKSGHDFVRNKFLITRHLREYLTTFISLVYESGDRIMLDQLPQPRAGG